jgi:hypothetical protein
MLCNKKEMFSLLRAGVPIATGILPATGLNYFLR